MRGAGLEEEEVPNKSLKVFAALDAVEVTAGFANGFDVEGEAEKGEVEGKGEGEAGGVKTPASLDEAPNPVKPVNLCCGSEEGELVTEALDLLGNGFNLHYN